MRSGHDSQPKKTGGVHDKHKTESARVEPQTTISPSVPFVERNGRSSGIHTALPFKRYD